ncbi:MAG: hypothetical protein CMO81_03880 [Waddliaceae bacterium]|nr:hypothetical protein [Waddliaceae bacterium]
MMGAGCNRAAERGGARAQTLLAEVELLNESRKFDKAQETLEEVFSILDELNQKDPSNLDFIFMRSKAYMLRFLSLNTQIIEKADIRKRSLVRMAEMHEYEGYDENIEALQALLIKVLNSERELTLSNRGFIHGMLAASCRLSDEKTNEAITQYGLAIKAYQTQLKKLKEEHSKMSPHTLAIQKLENTIRQIQLQQVEVLLLGEDWTQALGQLQTNMAGTDLQFFSTQFEIVEDHLEQIKEKIALADQQEAKTRGDKLAKALEDRRGAWSAVRDEVGGVNPYRSEQLLNQIYLADLKNNLIYRIICYYNLKQESELKEAEKVLGTYYPDVKADLMEMLEQYQ